MDSNPAQRKRIEEISRCPVCFDTLQDARFLPCGHTFCQSCVDSCRASTLGVSCPMCRTNSVVSLFRQLCTGRKDLPKNLVAQSLADVVRAASADAEPDIPIRGLRPARTAEVRPRPGRCTLWRICCWLWNMVFYIGCFLIVISAFETEYKALPESQKLNILTRASNICQELAHRISVKEEEQDFRSQIASFFQKILFAVEEKEEEKPESSWEKLREYLHQSTKAYCDGLEVSRQKQFRSYELWREMDRT